MFVTNQRTACVYSPGSSTICMSRQCGPSYLPYACRKACRRACRSGRWQAACCIARAQPARSSTQSIARKSRTKGDDAAPDAPLRGDREAEPSSGRRAKMGLGSGSHGPIRSAALLCGVVGSSLERHPHGPGTRVSDVAHAANAGLSSRVQRRPGTADESSLDKQILNGEGPLGAAAISLGAHG